MINELKTLLKKWLLSWSVGHILSFLMIVLMLVLLTASIALPAFKSIVGSEVQATPAPTPLVLHMGDKTPPEIQQDLEQALKTYQTQEITLLTQQLERVQKESERVASWAQHMFYWFVAILLGMFGYTWFWKRNSDELSAKLNQQYEELEKLGHDSRQRTFLSSITQDLVFNILTYNNSKQALNGSDHAFRMSIEYVRQNICMVLYWFILHRKESIQMNPENKDIVLYWHIAHSLIEPTNFFEKELTKSSFKEEDKQIFQNCYEEIARVLHDFDEMLLHKDLWSDYKEIMIRPNNPLEHYQALKAVLKQISERLENN
jgi:hypothetical protein